MADLKFQPVRHDHKTFLEKAAKRHAFSEAYDALGVENMPARARCWRRVLALV